MSIEYKCVAAPERVKRRRGAKTKTERVAQTIEEILAEEAVGGWEYLRTDLIPIEESGGLFGRRHEVHRAVLIFARDRDGQRVRPGFSAAAEPAHPAAMPAHSAVPEPTAASRAPTSGIVASTGRQLHRTDPSVPAGEDYPTDLSDARLAPLNEQGERVAHDPAPPPTEGPQDTAQTFRKLFKRR